MKEDIAIVRKKGSIKEDNSYSFYPVPYKRSNVRPKNLLGM